MLGISIPSLVVSAWAQAPSVGRQQLQGHLLPEFARSPLVGALADTTKLALAIALPLRNRSQLDTLMQQVSDPGSPQFRHYLTAAQFAAQFGPTDQDYQALITFVRAKGLTVTNVYANHVVLDVSGAASAIENAFYVKLNIYRRPDGSTFYAPDREPSLDLDVPVLHITGLDNYFIPKHSTLPHTTMESARRSASNVVPVAGSGPNGAFAGSDFRNAYAPGVKLTGQGQSVGILEFDGFFNSDPAAYKAKFGINVPVQVVTLNGFAQSATQSGPNGAPGGGQDVEVALDIEMAMAMAPGLQSVVVYEGSNADSILAAMVSPPSGIPKSFQLSASWTGWHPTVTTQQLFEMMGTMDGQTFFVSAGDGRAICPSEAGDDRALPFVTVVGGTILAMNGAGLSWQSETAASAGGGIEQGVPIPSYQTGLATGANGGSSTYRNIPDVAIVYNNVFVFANNGQQIVVGGTSAGTPLWAGYMALVNQQAQLDGQSPLGFINPTLRVIANDPPAYAKDFNDITSGGSTPSSCGPGYNATVGYDLVTGWGSPKAAIINDLITPPGVISPACAGIENELANLSPGDFQSEADFEAAFRRLEAQLRACEQQHPG